jgi:hypothetical protein
MQEVLNGLFSRESAYNNQVIRTRGLVLARIFCPREYTNKRGEKECSVLPEIIICEATKEAPIIISGSGIIAKGPAPAYILQFNPMWGKKYEKGEVMYKFENAFIPEEADEVGNIVVIKHNLTGRCDEKDIPGEIGFSSIKERDTTLYGQDNELESILRAITDTLPSKLYDIRHPALVDKNKYYKIKISDEETEKFAQYIARKLF